MKKETKEPTQELSKEQNDEPQTSRKIWITPELKILPVPGNTEGGGYNPNVNGDDGWYVS